MAEGMKSPELRELKPKMPLMLPWCYLPPEPSLRRLIMRPHRGF